MMRFVMDFGLKDDLTPVNVGIYKKSVTSAGDGP